MTTFNQVLHSLDDKQLTAASLAARNNKQEAQFNVAAWLNAPGFSNEEFSLMLSYVDGGKVHEVPVDQGRVNAMQDVLLSGIARLRISKKLEKLQLLVRSQRRPSRLVVENICLQPAV